MKEGWRAVLRRREEEEEEEEEDEKEEVSNWAELQRTVNHSGSSHRRAERKARRKEAEASRWRSRAPSVSPDRTEMMEGEEVRDREGARRAAREGEEARARCVSRKGPRRR